ncbi:MAG: Tetratricopeptide repeat protein [Deltaproteobacteria bacterium]|nr:Tetratricopeptide repeat protein [Deltaproteobacteria bacterium]
MATASRRLTRKDLRQPDWFQITTEKAIELYAGHRAKVLAAGAGLVVLLLAVWGWQRQGDPCGTAIRRGDQARFLVPAIRPGHFGLCGGDQGAVQGGRWSLHGSRKDCRPVPRRRDHGPSALRRATGGRESRARGLQRLPARATRLPAVAPCSRAGSETGCPTSGEVTPQLPSIKLAAPRFRRNAHSARIAPCRFSRSPVSVIPCCGG